MKTLYMIGLGGSIKGANVEVHSMQFVIANTIEETYKELDRRWFGEKLHIDSYTEIKYIDGYAVDLTETSEKDLYMVVYGGYKKGVIDELHDYSLILADSERDAKQQGKDQIHRFENMDHVDEIVNVFTNVGTRFGFIKGEYNFKDNTTVHTFVKLRK